MNFKNLDTKKRIVYSSFIAIGILAGYLYWKFVGCQSGSCAMKSNPYYSSLLGGMFGYLIPDTLYSRKKKENQDSESD